MVAPPYKYNDFSIHALLAESDHQTNAGSNESSDFLSTLSLRRATYDTYAKVLRVNFSIHALLAESDRTHAPSQRHEWIFYPRSPCGERPGCQRPCGRPTTNFYPRSPCGERHYFSAVMRQNPGISIHALLAESDLIQVMGRLKARLFLSTLSLRRATAGKHAQQPTQQDFYPRSPCGERQNRPRPSARINDFYPRSPCGERQQH